MSLRLPAVDASAGIAAVTTRLKQGFAFLREVTGDDAYERYLAHHQLHHADETLLDRRAFFVAEQQRKWTGIKRCC